MKHLFFRFLPMHLPGRTVLQHEQGECHRGRRASGPAHSRIAAALIGAVACVLVPWTAAQAGPESAAGGSPHGCPAGAGFIENQGQWSDAVRYHLPGGETDVYFTPSGIIFDLKTRTEEPGESAKGAVHTSGCAVALRFAQGAPSPGITAGDRRETTYSFFLGNDPAKWRSDLPAFGQLVYQGVWPGIDLAFRVIEGALVYEVNQAAGSRAEPGAFTFEGADEVRPDESGIERIVTAVGVLIHERTGSTGRIYRLEEKPGLEQGPAPANRDNPAGLRWSTFLGGSMGEQGTGVALDASGNAVVTGATFSSNYPNTVGAYDRTFNGGIDIVVSKISAAGDALLWSTFMGGNLDEEAHALVLDGSGNVYITGHTSSGNWPATPGAYDESFNGDIDALAAKLSPSGNSLLWSTYLGGTQAEEANSIILGHNQNVLVTGSAFSGDFPTTPGSLQPIYGGAGDAFVSAISSTGSTLLWSTFLGGTGSEAPWKVLVDASDNVAVAGSTGSSDFTTTPGAYSRDYSGGGSDAFVSVLAPSGSALLWSTFLGGTGGDTAYSLALDGSGRAVVTGGTGSSDFPTTIGALDSTLDGSDDIFVAKLSVSGDALLWSTLLGGGSVDYSNAIVLDSSGAPVLTGVTLSTDFPVTPGGIDASSNGGVDVFAVKLNAAGNHLLWSTYLGGSGADYGNALVLDASQEPVVAGVTGSANFPTTPGAYDRSANGSVDIYLAKLDGGAMTTEVRSLPEEAESALTHWAPNPMSGESALHLGLDRPGPLSARIFDGAGRSVRFLAGPSEGSERTGAYDLFWDGRNDAGARVRPGVYFYRISAGGETRTGKLTVIRR